MIQIFHNPRCGKSREALKMLEQKKLDFEVVEYLKLDLKPQILKNMLSKLNIRPIELVRKNEAVFKEKFKNKDLSDEEWIGALIEHPKLIERPIIIVGENAVIARPADKMNEIL